jgi:hypothetical protein
MNLFARNHGADQGYLFFDINAPQGLYDQLAATLSLGDPASP